MKRCQNKSNISMVRDYLSGERPFVQVGYVPSEIKRNVRDTWTDSKGITWIQKNGYKARLNKQADIIHKALGQNCNVCKRNVKWGTNFDRLFFIKTGMCQDCLIDYEHKIRLIGAYPLYEKCKVFSNQIGYLKDIKAKLLETIDYFSNSDGSIEILCNSEGFREKFHGTNKEQILADAKRDLKDCNKWLRVLTKEKNDAKRELKKKASEFKLEIYV